MHIHNGLKIAQTLCNQSSPFPALIGISGAQIGIVQEIWATFVSRCVEVVTYFYFCEGTHAKDDLFIYCLFIHALDLSVHPPTSIYRKKYLLGEHVYLDIKTHRPTCPFHSQMLQ